MPPFVRQGHQWPAIQQPPNAYADRLYYDSVVTTGGLQTGHFESNGLALRAEKEIRQVYEQSLKEQATQTQAFKNDKDALLKRQRNGTAAQKLKNPFAENPNVVDLRQLGESAGTPKLLRVADPKQPSEFDFPKDIITAKEPEGSDAGDVWDAGLYARVLMRKATVTLKPYQQEEVEKITAEDGWVIVARDLDGKWKPLAVNTISRRDDNPYGMHWQILLPNGKNIGYASGNKTSLDGKLLPNIGSESGKQYKGVVASGRNGEKMTEAVNIVKARWDERYIADPDGQRYNGGSHNCQNFTGEVLREYQRLLSEQH